MLLVTTIYLWNALGRIWSNCISLSIFFSNFLGPESKYCYLSWSLISVGLNQYRVLITSDGQLQVLLLMLPSKKGTLSWRTKCSWDLSIHQIRFLKYEILPSYISLVNFLSFPIIFLCSFLNCFADGLSRVQLLFSLCWIYRTSNWKEIVFSRSWNFY